MSAGSTPTTKAELLSEIQQLIFHNENGSIRTNNFIQRNEELWIIFRDLIEYFDIELDSPLTITSYPTAKPASGDAVGDIYRGEFINEVWNGTSWLVLERLADTDTTGLLSFTDWNTFNNKQGAITTGSALQYLRGNLTLATFPTALSSFSNDSGYITASSASNLTNKTGNISQWTNDSGYITTTGITPAALTRVDDTNITLTLGGTPNTALLQAVSLTLGWTGTLADNRIASAATWNAKESALTFNNGLTRSVNTVSIDYTKTGNVYTGNGLVSSSLFTYNGSWFTGGSATTTKPYILIEPTGTTSTAWSTAGTGWGMNAANGFIGNLIDAKTDNTSRFKVTYLGSTTINDLTIAGSAGYGIVFSSNDATITSNYVRVVAAQGWLIGDGSYPTAKLEVKGTGLTGSDATGTMFIFQTWNTSGTPTLFKGNVTNTASNAASLLLDLQVSTISKLNIGLQGNITNTGNNVVSNSLIKSSGTWFTGGSSTTTKPSWLLEPTGTTSTAWNTNGTGLGINAASGFTGNTIHSLVNNSTNFLVNYQGIVYSGYYFQVGTATIGASAGAGYGNANAPALRYAAGLTTEQGLGAHIFQNTQVMSATASYQNLVDISGNSFAPSSGSARYNSIYIADTMGQTGTASGVVCGIYINPTLSGSISQGNYRGIELSSNYGYGIYQSGTAGNYFAANGILSKPAMRLLGTWITAGDGTTTKPYMLIEPNGTTSSSWTIDGTGFGMNAANGFVGHLMNLLTNNVTKLILGYQGNLTIAGSYTSAAPSGGTSAAWKLGTVASVSPTLPDRTIELDVNGTTYYLHAKTTNN